MTIENRIDVTAVANAFRKKIYETNDLAALEALKLEVKASGLKKPDQAYFYGEIELRGRDLSGQEYD